MRISLQHTKCVLLTVEKYHQRYLEVMDRITGKLTATPFYGFDLPRPHGFNNSIIKLYNSVVPPVLIIEDDVDLTEHYINEFDVPDDADAVYLGTSSWGGKNGISAWKNIELIPHDDLLFRVDGVATTHAILYLSNRYLDHICNITFKQYPQNTDRCLDYYIAQEHSKFNIYACRKPMFYQNDGGNVFLTSYSLQQVYHDKYGS